MPPKLLNLTLVMTALGVGLLCWLFELIIGEPPIGGDYT